MSAQPSSPSDKLAPDMKAPVLGLYGDAWNEMLAWFKYKVLG